MSAAARRAREAGALLWCGFDGLEAPLELLARIARRQVGATILFSRNVARTQDWPEQVAALVGALRGAAREGDAPHLVTIDQEGGRVQRLRAPATEWPPMRALGALGDVALCERVGRALGDELAALGIGCGYAPVLDVDTNPANPVIGDRSFGRDARAAGALATALARGLRASGVLPCGKHFPGHGDTLLDSHLALPRIDHPIERIEAVELAPFATAIADGLELIMTAHVVFGALDPTVPATLSPMAIDGLLRRRLGFRGVVVSDDLEMKAVAERWEVEELVVRGLRAGCDAFLLCHRAELQERALRALVDAAGADAEVAGRLTESAARVAALSGWSARAVPPPGDPGAAGRALRERAAAHRALADRVRGAAP